MSTADLERVYTPYGYGRIVSGLPPPAPASAVGPISPNNSKKEEDCPPKTEESKEPHKG